MSDMIERQKAIEAIKKCVQDMRKYPLPDELKKNVAENILKDVPSVDTVPVRHGQWVGESDGYADGYPVYDIWSCSCCGTYFDEWDEKPTWKYCPNCGAKMTEVDR